MNPQQLFARLQAATSALTGRQLVTLAFAFVAVVGVTIASAYWLNTPSYEVLFSDLDPESAGTVVARLKAAKVNYELEDGGRTVKVPASRLDELRLDVASQGMPGTGRIGFEIFDRTSFGVTDFMEHVNYRRALEGELARTIATIGEVSGARVHIAMPPASLFVGQSQPTTASVVLKLRQNRQLAPQTVTAITNFVAASVESLRPESVVVIDNFGRPLSRPTTSPDDLRGTEQLERQQRVEQDLSMRLVSMLEPIVGDGRVRVNVNAKISTGSQEETEERFDPNPIVRSQQRASQASGGGVGLAAPTFAGGNPGGSPLPGAAGVAGARANLPAPPQPAAPAAAATVATAAPVAVPTNGSNSLSETTNYEISKITRHTIQPQGQIARLSVAVVLDDSRAPATDGKAGKATPRSPEEIQKIRELVTAAVGFDPMRGDQLTVENIAFEEAPVEDVTPQPIWVRYQPQAFEAVRILGIVALAAFAFFGVIRPMVAGSLGPTHAMARTGGAGGGAQPRTVHDLESEIDAQLQAAADSAGPRRLPVLTRRATTLSEKDPENTARLLRAWLTEEER